MLTYLRQISSHNASILKSKYQTIFCQLDNLLEEYQYNIENESEIESGESEDEEADIHRAKLASHLYKSISNLKDEFKSYITQLPVSGFNLSKYDITLIKHQIMSYISMQYNESDFFLLKEKIQLPHLN